MRLIQPSKFRRLFEQDKRAWDDEYLMGPEDFDPYSDSIGKQLFGSEAEHIQIALSATGAKAIPRGEKHTPLLGEGAYGTVIEVFYKGHRCAMKITLDEEDFNGYEEIKGIYDKLPNFVKRHLPLIYEMGKTNVESVEWGSDTVFYTIMEILQPLPTGLALQGWGYDNTGDVIEHVFAEISKRTAKELPRIIDRALRSASRSASAASLLSNWLQGRDFYNEMIDADVIKATIQPNIEDLYPKHIIKMLMNFIKQFLQVELLQGMAELKKSNSDTKILDGFADIIGSKQIPFAEVYNDIENELTSIAGPVTRDWIQDDNTKTKISSPKETLKDPRLIKLNSAINWLADNGLAYQGDMHPGNVMYRPSTNDLVAVDVGNWSF